MSTPTANLNLDQPNAETRAATARLPVSEIMRVPGGRAAKIRIDKLKESENDAVMSVYSDVFGSL